MTLKSEVWGPHYWFFLHTCGFTYPKYPNDITKKKFYNLLTNFSSYIPVEEIATYYDKMIIEYPIEPYLDDRESLVRWIWFIHNKINERLEKPKITLEEFYVSYFEKYKSRETTFIEKYKIIKKLVSIAFILFLSIFIAYWYNK